MLTKLTQQVIIPGRAAKGYRPYSRNCPIPPPATQPTTPQPRPVTKTVCGTVETYTFTVFVDAEFGAAREVKETLYVLPGLPATNTYVGLPYGGYTVKPGSLRLVSSSPYCTTVTVYE